MGLHLHHVTPPADFDDLGIVQLGPWPTPEFRLGAAPFRWVPLPIGRQERWFVLGPWIAGEKRNMRISDLPNPR
jgi:hypothetical protein